MYLPSMVNYVCYIHYGNSYPFCICVGNLPVNPVTITFQNDRYILFQDKRYKVENLYDEKTPETQNVFSNSKAKKQRRLLIELKTLRGPIAAGTPF